MSLNEFDMLAKFQAAAREAGAFDEMLTPSQLAKRAGIPQAAVARMIDQGLPRYEFQRGKYTMTRILWSEFIEYARQRFRRVPQDALVKRRRA